MSGADDIPDDMDLLAGEYVVGGLDVAELRAARLRVAREPAFEAAVIGWQNRLEPLTALVRPVPPPAALWDRIAVSSGERPARPRGLALVWSNPAVWRGTTVGALALAAAVAAFAVLRPPPPPIFIASLAPMSAPGPTFVADTLPNGGIRVRPVGPVSVAADRNLELWALPQGAAKPIPLGVLPTAGRVVSPGDLTRAKTKLLISLEPTGGSPTGQPTGPVLYGGTLFELN